MRRVGSHSHIAVADSGIWICNAVHPSRVHVNEITQPEPRIRVTGNDTLCSDAQTLAFQKQALTSVHTV